MNPLHSQTNPAYGTPWPVATAAICTMGEIDLDPASSATSNEVIGAKEFFDVARNGLARPWKGKVFLNPPGGVWRGNSKRPDNWARLSKGEQAAVMAEIEAGKALLKEHHDHAKKQPWHQKTQSIAATWWDRLIYEYTIGNVDQAIFVAFNVEILAMRPQMLDYPHCKTVAGASDSSVNGLGRLKFLDDQGVSATAPTHANAFIFLPPRRGTERLAVDSQAVRSFMGNFAKFGRVGMMLNPFFPLTQTADGRLYIADQIAMPPVADEQTEVAA